MLYFSVNSESVKSEAGPIEDEQYRSAVVWTSPGRSGNPAWAAVSPHKLRSKEGQQLLSFNFPKRIIYIAATSLIRDGRRVLS